MAGGGGAEVRKAGGAASACARGERSTRGPLQSQRVREGEGGRGGEGEANRHGERWHRNARVLRLARPRERAQRRSHRRVRTELLPQHPVHHEGVAIAPSRQELVHAVQSRSERVRLTNNEQNKTMNETIVCQLDATRRTWSTSSSDIISLCGPWRMGSSWYR